MTTLLRLDLRDRRVLVAGGGPAAARQARGLADDGARVRIVASSVCEDMTDLLAASPAVSWRVGEVAASDLAGVWLAVAATGDDRRDRQVAAWAQALHVWCLGTGAGSATAPAVARSGEVQVAVTVDPAPATSVPTLLDQESGAHRAMDRAGSDTFAGAYAEAVRDRLAELLREGASTCAVRASTRARKVTGPPTGPVLPPDP
ncbi:NAD(P)-dependent oxidoreductase [Oerskovia sp. M15]